MPDPKHARRRPAAVAAADQGNDGGGVPAPVSFAAPSAEESPGFLLWQVTMLWQRRLRAVLQPHQLTHAQFVLLAGLAWLSRDEAPISQNTLARHTRLDVMMTSQVLRTLEANGFLTRRPHPRDPRAKALALTVAGRERVQAALRDVEAADAAFFAAPGMDAGALLPALRALIAGAESLGPADR